MLRPWPGGLWKLMVLVKSPMVIMMMMMDPEVRITEIITDLGQMMIWKTTRGMALQVAIVAMFD